MTLKNRKYRPPSAGQSQPRFSLESEPAPPEGSFHAVLREWTEGRADQPKKPRRFSLPFRPRESEPGRPRFSALGRAWSWVHRQYGLSATKRMRVVETLPLGEKRFVAVVRVEDREFLVGGGASGVSLLAQLGAAPGPVGELRTKFDIEEDTE